MQIESKTPSTEADIFEPTHAATERIKNLAEEIEENKGKHETGARKALGEDFAFIVKT
ncbi:DUF5713 family protein [Roseibacillus persicicus]|uniref:DUF5713 family protein n=1 Tax=Roseibacillus persicicus TaxID=454148 RepID=UPI00398A892E